MILPPPLRPGATVELIAPAGPITPEGLERAVRRVESLGWRPVVGRHAAGREGYLSGTDAQRLADLDHALRSRQNDAIWCLRGGYGVMRILPAVDWTPLRHRPRPLIGFSDNTALHLAASRAGLVTFHGPHAAAANLTDGAVEHLCAVVGTTDRPAPLPPPPGTPPPSGLVGGRAEGRLVGGNLALLAATAGTPFQVDARGAILFVEEVGEAAYRIDRMLTQLALAGVLDGVAGIAIGAVTEVPDLERPDLPPPDEVFRDRLGRLGVPLVTGLPFGHIDHGWTLPVGIRAALDGDAGELRLLEPAVAG